MPNRNSHDINQLEESLSKLNSTNPKHIILTGDFNCPDIHWESGNVKDGAVQAPIHQQLVDLAMDLLKLLIHQLEKKTFWTFV